MRNPYVTEEAEEEAPTRSIGRAVLGWVLFACLTAFLGWFCYRLWFYYGQLRSGAVIELPQYTDKFTAVGSGSSMPVSAEGYTDAAVTGSGRPSMGPEDAPLTVTVFADFECPFSKDAYTAYRALMAKYGDRVRFIYREHPLGSIHPEAMQAAMAAECANEQGRFWVYHDKLFLNSPALAFDDLVRYAGETGMDEQQFERCLAEGRYRSTVEVDGAAAIALGVRGTPTFFFNGRAVEGAVPQDVLETLIMRFIE